LQARFEISCLRWRAFYRLGNVATHARLSIRHFLFSKISSAPFVALRILLSFVLLFQAIQLSGEVPSLFGRLGFLQSDVNDFFAISGGNLALASQLGAFVSRLGVDDVTYMQGMFLLYTVSLASLLLGFGTRLSSISACLFHFLVFGAGHMSSYGVDRFAQCGLFFLIWSPTERSRAGNDKKGVTSTQNFSPPAMALRGLQLYLCIAYFGAGVAKAMGVQWWNGEAVFRAILLTAGAPYQVIWLAHFPWLARLSSWGTLVLEIGYPFFIWPKRTRRLWIILTLSMHLGIAIFLGLVSFSAVMAVLTFCAFGVNESGKKDECSGAKR